MNKAGIHTYMPSNNQSHCVKGRYTRHHLQVVQVCKEPGRLREQEVAGQHRYLGAKPAVHRHLACARHAAMLGQTILHFPAVLRVAACTGGLRAAKPCLQADTCPGQVQAPPLRMGLSSTTSSCIKLAVCIISVISASRLCFSVMSLWTTCMSVMHRTPDNLHNHPCESPSHALCCLHGKGRRGCMRLRTATL